MGFKKEILKKIKFFEEKRGGKEPYSPNFNPIERLWKFMKKKVMANRYFEHFCDFKMATMEFFRGIRKYKAELVALITDNFQLVGT